MAYAVLTAIPSATAACVTVPSRSASARTSAAVGFARFRPPSPWEQRQGPSQQGPEILSGTEVLVHTGKQQQGQRRTHTHRFRLTEVFGPSARQQDVYGKVAFGVVENVLQGCVFSRLWFLMLSLSRLGT